MNMETIYVDSMKHCHRINDGTMKSVQTAFFVGKCDALVEGYAIDDSKGYPQVYPWQPLSELEAAQAQYERDMAELAEAYQEGVDSV